MHFSPILSSPALSTAPVDNIVGNKLCADPDSLFSLRFRDLRVGSVSN